MKLDTLFEKKILDLNKSNLHKKLIDYYNNKLKTKKPWQKK